MRRFDRHVFRIGTHFLSALIDGDYSGLAESDHAAISAWQDEVASQHGTDGHWATIDDTAEEFAECEVTGLRGATERVAYMTPTGGPLT